MALLSSPIKIWRKSFYGILSYDRTNKQTNRDFYVTFYMWLTILIFYVFVFKKQTYIWNLTVLQKKRSFSIIVSIIQNFQFLKSSGFGKLILHDRALIFSKEPKITKIWQNKKMFKGTAPSKPLSASKDDKLSNCLFFYFKIDNFQFTSLKVARQCT